MFAVFLVFVCRFSSYFSLPRVFDRLPSVFNSLPNVFRRCGRLAPLASAQSPQHAIAWRERYYFVLKDLPRRSLLDVGLINYRKLISNTPPGKNKTGGRAWRAPSPVFAGGRIANQFVLID